MQENENAIALRDSIVTRLQKFDTEADWLAARRSGIGASEVAAALGMDPFKTRLELYLEKRNGIETERSARAREAAEWGKIHEPAILRAFSKDKRVHVVAPPLCMMTHESIPWMRSSPDGFAVFPERIAIVQAKSRGFLAKRYWDDGPPRGELAQVQAEMAVTGVDEAWIPVLFNGNEYQCFGPFYPHEKFQKSLIAALGRFWERVMNGDPPAPVSANDAKLVLRSMDTAKNVEVELGPEAAVWREEEKRLADLHSKMEKRVEEVKAELDEKRSAIRNAILAKGGNVGRFGPIGWRVAEVTVPARPAAGYSYTRLYWAGEKKELTEHRARKQKELKPC